jgi:hypothetical protein
VRNQALAEKLFRNQGTREDITTVEADIMSDRGVKNVVENMRNGEFSADEKGDCVMGSWRVV